VAVELSPALALAGCRLVEQGRKLVVLDRDGQELERAGRGRWAWLLAVCELLLIERWSEALGLSWTLHPAHLSMRLWWPGEEPEAAPWRAFGVVLSWLVEEAPTSLVAREVEAQHRADALPSRTRISVRIAGFDVQNRTKRHDHPLRSAGAHLPKNSSRAPPEGRTQGARWGGDSRLHRLV
jgi:hypothetical protein